MNAVMETILKRRSTRSYKPDPLARQDLETILQAAIHAPTGATAEPWHFTVITDKNAIDSLDIKARKAMSESGIERIVAMGDNPAYRIFFNAPVVIIISGENVLRKPGTHLSSLADCSAAIQNMQLAATSLDIGSCWIGLIRYLFAQDKSMAPEGYTPLFALCLGYASGTETLPPRQLRTGTITWMETGGILHDDKE